MSKINSNKKTHHVHVSVCMHYSFKLQAAHVHSLLFSSLSSLLPPLQRTLCDPNPSLCFESLLRALVSCTTSAQASSVMSHPLASGSICIDDKTSQTQHMQRVRPSGFSTNRTSLFSTFWSLLCAPDVLSQDPCGGAKATYTVWC